MNRDASFSGFVEKLESEALYPGCNSGNADFLPSGSDLALMSIAISLKRIADAIDGTTQAVNISESLAGLTGEIMRHRP